MIKYKKKIFTILVFLLVFFLGLLTERFHIDNKVADSFKGSYDEVSRFIYSFLPREEISLLIKPKEYKKIIEVRNQSIKQNKLTKDLEKWSDGKLLLNDEARNVQIRLKGVFSDHWSDDKQWSFKLKIKNDSKPLNGLKRFALQPPKTNSYIYEWLFMKALEKENLFSLGAEFIDLKINEKNLGAYTVIGQISDELIKKNNKQIAPIIGFDSELWIKEQMQASKLDSKGVFKRENNTEDSYYRAKINPIQFKMNKKDDKMQQLKEAINLLESFRQGNIKTSETFDTDKLAKVMALRALLGSFQFDWLDTKFYYNLKTKLLEPISKEIHVDLNHNYELHYSTWWIDSYKPNPSYVTKKDFFVDDIYKDKIFYDKYLKQLNKFSKIRYFEDLIKENNEEFKHYLKMLKMNYPTKKVFSRNHLEVTRLRIQNFLNPVQGLKAYFSKYEKGVLNLNISNLQRIPIIIKGISYDDNSILDLNEKIFLEGKKPYLPVKIEDVKFNCNFKSNCKKNRIQNQRVIYKILGQDEDKYASISQFYK